MPIVPSQSKPVNTNGITNLQSWTSQIYITWQPCGYGWHGTMEWWFRGKSSLEHQVQYPHATGLKHSTEGTYSLPWNNAEHSWTSIQNFYRTYVYTKTCTWQFIAKKTKTQMSCGVKHLITSKWLNKLRGIHTMEYHATIKKNKLLYIQQPGWIGR